MASEKSSSEPPAKKARRAEALLKAEGRGLPGFTQQEHGGAVKPFRFVQMADTQLGMEATCYTHTKVKTWENELAMMRKAAEEINRLRPAFAIVCGDLTDEYPVEATTEAEVNRKPEVHEQQVKDFKEACKSVDADIPLLCLCGNHDIGNRPNSATLKRFVDGFGDDYFAFWCHGVKCLVLNTQLWKDDTDAKESRAAMDKWLEGQLEECDATRRAANGSPCPLVIFSHIPPYIFDAEEQDEYFNLARDVRKPWLEKFARRGAVAWFCGHYHRNAGGVYQHESGQKLEVVITAAVGCQIVNKEGGDPLGKSGFSFSEYKLGEEHSGLRVVDVQADGSLKHHWHTFAEATAKEVSDH